LVLAVYARRERVQRADEVKNVSRFARRGVQRETSGRLSIYARREGNFASFAGVGKGAGTAVLDRSAKRPYKIERTIE
jgi:hypothetical protein